MSRLPTPKPPQPAPPRMPGQAVATADGEFFFNVMLTVHKIPNAAAVEQLEAKKAQGYDGPVQIADDMMDIAVKATLVMARPSPITQTGELFPVDGPIIARWSLKLLRAAWEQQKARQGADGG